MTQTQCEIAGDGLTLRPRTFRRGRLAGFVASLIGWVFALSCVSKLVWPTDTLRVLTEVWHFGRPLSVALFTLLIAVEAALAIVLVAGRRPRLSLAVAGVFLLLVSVSPLRQALVGSELACGCGLSAGAAETPADHWRIVGRNILLSVLCLAPTLFSRQEIK